MHGLLTALFDGATLGGALDAAARAGQLTDEDAPRVMGWFHDWVRYGFFRAVARTDADGRG